MNSKLSEQKTEKQDPNLKLW